MPETTEFEINIFELVDTDGFDFTSYAYGERTILAPALEKAGYILIGSWYSIEKDSFGPLSRGIPAFDPDGNRIILYYA